MSINLGTLEQVITDKGGDALLAKLGLIDAAATKAGAKPITVGLSAPGAASVAQGLTTVNTKVSDGLQLIALLGKTQGTLSQTSTALTAATAGLTSALERLAAASDRSTQSEERSNETSETAAETAERKRRAAERYTESINNATKGYERLTKAELDEIRVARQAEAQKMAGLKSGPMLGPGLPGMTTAAAAQASAAATQNLATAQQRATATATQQGAVLQQTTQRATLFGREITKADGSLTSFSRRGVTALNGIAFGFAQMATQGETSLRSLASSATSVLAFMGPKGAVGAIAAAVGLSAFDIFKAGEKRQFEVRSMLAKAAAKDELTIEKAKLDLMEATEKAAFDQGTKALGEFYDKRLQIIKDRNQAEIESRKATAAALEQEARDREKFVTAFGKTMPEFMRNATIQQAAELRSQAKSLRTEATALSDQGAAEIERNAAERLAAERQLNTQLLDFENRRREAIGETHQARLAQINQEVAAFARLPLRAGESAEQREAARKALEDALKAQANFERAQTDFSRLQGDLDRRRLEVQQRLNAGKMTQLEADKAIADIERSSVPTLTQMLDRMEGFAQGSEEALAVIRRLRTELEGIGTNLTPFQQNVIGLRNQVEDVFGQLGMSGAQSFANALSAGLTSSMTKGSGKNFFEAFGNALLAGLGGTFVQIGTSLMTYGLILLAAPALAALFPALTLSAGQALGAGAALVALGTGMGAVAANNSGSRTGSGASTSFRSPDRDTVQHIWLDPDRRLNQQRDQATAVVRQSTAQSAPLPIIQNHFTIIGPNDPRAQASISELAVNAVRAGYSMGNG